MSGELFRQSSIQEAIAALKEDLLLDDGPRISTMRNYSFAILPYNPSEEFALRAEVRKLSHELIAGGWAVRSISLRELLMRRLRGLSEEHRAQIVMMEQAFTQMGKANPSFDGLERSLTYLQEQIIHDIEGPQGLAQDVVDIIQQHCAEHPEQADRMVVLIGRAGALYPFFRSSALLRHIANKTNNVPVVLLYPGTRQGKTGLSFMGVLKPDSDYRPRIYP